MDGDPVIAPSLSLNGIAAASHVRSTADNAAEANVLASSLIGVKHQLGVIENSRAAVRAEIQP